MAPYDSTKPIKYDLINNVLVISNVGGMATGTSFDVTIRVLLSNYDADLQAIVTMDSNPNTASPLYYGTSQMYPLKTNSYV